jgi:hypothetical protein
MMLDLYHSLRYRLSGRCWACHRRVILHTPRRWRVCVNTPAAILLPNSVVPASQTATDSVA